MKKLLLILLCLPLLFTTCQENNPTPNNNSNNNNSLISGCTNPNAFNYNASATVDDGSCNGLPQHISGIQLGEYYLGGTVFHLDSINNIGMVFKGYYCPSQTLPSAAFGGLPHAGTNMWEMLGTDTLFGSGISNTQILYTHNTNDGNSRKELVEIFSDYNGDCTLGVAYGRPIGLPMFEENGNINPNGWYIPSLGEVRKIYDYGIMPHWDTINFPNGIRGWAQSWTNNALGGTHYSSVYSGHFPYSGTQLVYTSSEAYADVTKFYLLDFSNGNASQSHKFTSIAPADVKPIFGVRNFYYNP